ncbi:phosphotransferase family protein [Paenibacillus wenxiniae]|uniref:Phosphotransferase family protein n=1 Tax=Paenibacillus wenxiniae TaxID=1636843 RepID=A0ABW4RLW8_9BACL
MENVTDICWQVRSPELEILLTDDCMIETLEPGFEAQVFKLLAGGKPYVLKWWNRESKPDMELQYNVLSMLHQHKLAVSNVYGYGTYQDHGVLLTSYDGKPIRKITTPHVSLLARELAGLHKLATDELQEVDIPAYGQKSYFYSGIDQYAELSDALDELIRHIQWREPSIIHGDYHLANIVYDGARYTIIDWTNVQQMDARLDLAWALLILQFYVSPRYERVFRQTYLDIQPQANDQLDAFTGLAFLRWLMQYEKGHTPRIPGARKRAQELVQHNKWLQQHTDLFSKWIGK